MKCSDICDDILVEEFIDNLYALKEERLDEVLPFAGIAMGFIGRKLLSFAAKKGAQQAAKKMPGFLAKVFGKSKAAKIKDAGKLIGKKASAKMDKFDKAAEFKWSKGFKGNAKAAGLKAAKGAAGVYAADKAMDAIMGSSAGQKLDSMNPEQKEKTFQKMAQRNGMGNEQIQALMQNLGGEVFQNQQMAPLLMMLMQGLKA